MGRRFLSERLRDPYYRAAQAEGLRSRAAFKLAHLSERYPIFHEGDHVLDLGAAPGGWTVVARRLLGRTGRVVAVDERPVAPLEGVVVVRGRVGDSKLLERLGREPFDVVLSDMSPKISGAYATDHARSVELVRSAFALARAVLRPGGSFVAKVFEGDLLGELDAEIRREFARFTRTKPPASRSGSSELYLIGLGFRGPRAAVRSAGPERLGPDATEGPAEGLSLAPRHDRPARPDRGRAHGGRAIGAAGRRAVGRARSRGSRWIYRPT